MTTSVEPAVVVDLGQRRRDRAATGSGGASLFEAALWYAEHGHPVFPLAPGTKVPMRGSAGCTDATLDLLQVREWWTRTPDANIGLATGRIIDVVDIDGPPGHASVQRDWARTFARIYSETIAIVATPRAGGRHLYVPAQGDGNMTGVLPGIDYRGRGGYVVAPPSRTQAGAYVFLDVHGLLGGPAPGAGA